MQYLLYHILIGCGYNFLARCMPVVVLHTGLPNRFIYCVLCHVRNALVENMIKKNRSRFPIAILLTTVISNHQMTANLFFLFYNYNFEIFGARNTPLERYFKTFLAVF
jgi:hypothetical protein